MKKVFWFMVALALLPQAMAQTAFSFYFDNDVLEAYGTPGDYMYLNGRVENPGSDSVTVIWAIDSVNVESGWVYYICDNDLCYPPNVFSKPMKLAGGETRLLKVNAETSSTPFDGTIHLSVKLETDSTDAGNISVNFFTATESIDPLLQAGVSMGQNYPNPTSAETRIPYDLKGNEGLIQISDLQGRILFQYPLNPAERELVVKQALPSGFYFYSLVVDGRNLVTRSMIQN